MELIDTHCHLYLPEFDPDRAEVTDRAREAGVRKVFLPAIDSRHHQEMVELADSDPSFFFPMIGLHPTSVKAGFSEELLKAEQWLSRRTFAAIGEVGIDLYWDTTYHREQETALRRQIAWARETGLPLVIHSRNSMDEILRVFREEQPDKLKGVFHCFSGTLPQAREIISWGFFLGIGGVVTYKNSQLADIVKETGLASIVIETDAPYLSPVPYRGRRNEPAYLIFVIQKLAEICGIPAVDVASVIARNSERLFATPSNPSGNE